MTRRSVTRIGTPLLASILVAAGFATSASAPLAQSIDFDVIFNCSADGPLGDQTPEQCLEARTLMLNSCTACHTFVPIVKAQKTPEGWDATLGIHRSRVPDLSDEQFEAIGDFLRAHFNDTVPPPQLPPELEQLGTGLPA